MRMYSLWGASRGTAAHSRSRILSVTSTLCQRLSSKSFISAQVLNAEFMTKGVESYKRSGLSLVTLTRTGAIT